MNGSTAKLLRKFSKMTALHPDKAAVGYTDLKRRWHRQLDKNDRTDIRQRMKDQIEEFNQLDEVDQSFFVPR